MQKGGSILCSRISRVSGVEVAKARKELSCWERLSGLTCIVFSSFNDWKAIASKLTSRGVSCGTEDAFSWLEDMLSQATY